MMIDRSDPEWGLMWAALFILRGDTTAKDPETHEVWQYMGTHKHDGLALHDFRHRCHPSTQRRECQTIVASPEFARRFNAASIGEPTQALE